MGHDLGDLTDRTYTPVMRVDLLGTDKPAVAGETGTVDGVRLGGRRAQVIVTALALERGTVSAERLAGMIWPEDRPTTWPVALRGVVRGLRVALDGIGGGGQAVIATDPSGYRLATAVQVDVEEQAQAVHHAKALARDGRHRTALGKALTTSRISGDQLLPGVDADWLRPHRAALDELARQALELVAEAAGALGEHGTAVAAARQAVANNPLDEHAHRSLIRALDLSGDRAGAVRAFEDCRSSLAELLGIDPSSQTVQVYLLALRDQAPSTPARIPAPSSSFVGRSVESARLLTLLASPALVTVVGLGGVGKSRLVAHVATTVDSPGGRLWTALGAVTEDELVPATVALQLGVPLGTQDPTASVAAYLAPLGRTLLVLDGCEAALDGAASLASALLTHCPQATVVATSRVPLGVEGERVLRLEPLPQPSTADDLASSVLMRLLRDRVRDSGGDIAAGEGDVVGLTELLRRCGGLPLAVELVAAQLAAMPVGDLLDQLPQVLDDPLRAVAHGSYALLDEQEAAVFRRFAVLDGSVGLSLVRQVVSGDDVPAVRVVRILRELTAAGLVTVERGTARWRYRQDDGLRRFARDLLVERGEETQALRRLASAVRDVLPEDARSSPAPFVDTVNDLLGSLRSLFSAGLAGRADESRCLELAFRLHRYWAATNVAEGRFWLSRFLAVSPAGPWSDYATYALGYLDYWSGNTDDAVAELSTVVDRWDGTEEPYAARALIFLAGLLDDTDRGTEAVEYVRRSIVAAEPFGTDLRVSAAMGLGSVLSERADPEAATYALRAIDLCRTGGSTEQFAAALPTAAMVCWQVGDLDNARKFIEEARPLHVGTRRIARVVLLSASAGLALADGDLAGAVDFGRTADEEATDLGVEREVPLIRAVLSRAYLAAGDLPHATFYAAGAIEVALAMTVTYPLAIGLECAALLLRDHPRVADLVASATAVRHRGDRPPPPTLAAALRTLPTNGRALDAHAAGRLALTLLRTHAVDPTSAR